MVCHSHAKDDSTPPQTPVRPAASEAGSHASPWRESALSPALDDRCLVTVTPLGRSLWPTSHPDTDGAETK